MFEEIISEIFPLLIFVVIGIFASLGKVKKAKATQGSRGPQATEGDSANQKKPAGFFETFKQTMKDLIDEDNGKSNKDKKEDAPVAAVAPTSSTRIPLERKELKANMKEIAPTITGTFAHSHSADDATVAGKPVKVKTEKVVVGGSAGGEITEGCIEHYGIRSVIDEFPVTDEAPELNELQRILVLGEILNNPRYKNASYKRN